MHNAASNLQTVQDLCVEVVARNFEENPTFGPLPDKFIRKITNTLSLDLPLELVGAVSAAHGAQRVRMCHHGHACVRMHARTCCCACAWVCQQAWLTLPHVHCAHAAHP